MPVFILNRDFVVRSRFGRSIEFKKDVETYVPNALVREVVAAGAVPAEGEEGLVQAPVGSGPQTEAELQDKIRAAFEELVAKGNEKDFTATGIPAVRAVESIVGVNLSSAQVKDAWGQFKAEKVE
jgi:hypothetical protein